MSTFCSCFSLVRHSCKATMKTICPRPTRVIHCLSLWALQDNVQMYTHPYIYSYIHTYQARIQTSKHPSIHTSTHTYIHTYIHTYVHVCIHAACIHIYMQRLMKAICPLPLHGEDDWSSDHSAETSRSILWLRGLCRAPS